ncbi:membrane protein insertion efficiency factor YidD [Verrucomicrobiota bacterium]
MIRKVLIFIVKAYQKALSPLFGDCCRFYPCCSSYCITAISKHGCLKGLWLTLLRLCKCHPFHPGGEDYVPEKSNEVMEY